MGLFSNKRATKMGDFKGMRLRTPGWYMDIMNSLGASVSPLPGGELYLALERGVMDAADVSSPAMNYPMGFGEITSCAIQPVVHQPGIQCALFFNMEAWKLTHHSTSFPFRPSLPELPGALPGEIYVAKNIHVVILIHFTRNNGEEYGAKTGLYFMGEERVRSAPAHL